MAGQLLNAPSGLLPPFSVGFVKGWRRSLATLIICEGVKSLGIDVAELRPCFKAEHGRVWREALLSNTRLYLPMRRSRFLLTLPTWQASLAVVHGAVGRYTTPKEAIWASRGFNLGLRTKIL